MDLLDDTPGGNNAPEFTVSELSGAVKRVIEGEFAHVRVRGEIGRAMTARTGHVYFDLKDDRSVIACVTWKGQAARLTVRPEEGMEVIATGRMTTFGPQSKYQLNVEDIRPAGVGALMAMLEKRKALLEAEGLFAAGRKRPLPFLPGVIGVVTSPSGAVIRDILHRLRDRFPRRVVIWPVAVQGQTCAAEVARAIEGFNRLAPGGAIPRPDVLIVARGGGSIEDLWGFNEEIVARAAAASAIPLISAVGHETDTTLIDYASDRRAPTPTAAAEIAVPVRAELLAGVAGQGARLDRWAGQRIALLRRRLGDVARALPRPEALFAPARHRLAQAGRGLPVALRSEVHLKRAALMRAAAPIRPPTLAARVVSGRRAFDPLTVRLGLAIGRLAVAKGEAMAAVSGRLAPALERSLRDHRRRNAEGRRTLAEAVSRMRAAQIRALRARADRLSAADRLRQSLGYVETLARGYAVVWSGERLVTSAAAAREAGPLDLEFRDGRVPAGAASEPAPRPKPRRRKPPDQGTLF